MPTDPIRPLHDVWLRPRRVFRELAPQPIAAVDYWLGAAQGMAGWLALSRAQNAGSSSGIWEIFGKALTVGALAGVASLFFMGLIYTRLSARAGKVIPRAQIFHVLAYGGVPTAASLVLWLFTALLAGEPTFEQVQRPDLEGFLAIILRVQFLAYVLLTVWSVVIQVMGLSEILALPTRKAFVLWILGQVVGVLAVLFLMIVLWTLFPNPMGG